MKAGDVVVLAVLPPWVHKLPEESQRVFAYCLGREYSIDEVTPEGLLVLDVSRDVDDVFGGFMNDIRVEPEFVRPTK